MNCIAIDTTNENLCVVLIKDDNVYTLCRTVGKSGHSSMLMPAVDAVLKDGGVAVEELDGVAVVVGPGSFTGIRIGVSAATALAYATGAKRISVGAFDLIAINRRKVSAAVDAGHGNLYVAECEDGKTLSTGFVENADGMRSLFEFEPLEDQAVALEKTVRSKYAQNDFVQVFEPFYLRKTQAERNNEI